MSWLPNPDTHLGVDRVYAPDAAAMVLEPRVLCPATHEQLPLSDACYTTCLARCGISPQWTEKR